MNALVTGGAGYLGSAVTAELLARNHNVRVLDAGYFGVDHIRQRFPRAQLYCDNLDHVLEDPCQSADMLQDIDCVIHLAALSNDASAERDPELTNLVNVKTTLRLAELARSRGIGFLFSSSCSVYGNVSHDVDESFPTQALTSYARSKVKAEQNLLQMSCTDWRPVCLRNGTLFGYSPRMRFDLVVNGFSLAAVRSGRIQLFGSGDLWRPYLHVVDCARAFVYFFENRDTLFPVYNIAFENLRLSDLAGIFAKLVPGLEICRIVQPGQDQRDYRVSTSRMRLQGLDMYTSVKIGARDLIDMIKSERIADLGNPKQYNAQWMESILKAPKGRK